MRREGEVTSDDRLRGDYGREDGDDKHGPVDSSRLGAVEEGAIRGRVGN